MTIGGFGFVGRSKRDGKKRLLNINPLDWGELPFELAEGKNRVLLAVPENVKQGMRDELRAPPKTAYARDMIGRLHTCRVKQKIRDEMWGDASYRARWKVWEQDWWPL